MKTSPDTQSEHLRSLNDKQKEAVVSDAKRILVLAGAGSGKTKTLLQKLIYLTEEKGLPASSILAITFTKNAANEMLDRLILTTDTDGSYQKVLLDKRLKQEQKDQERRRRKKEHKWIDNLTVKTFHSLSYSILRNYGVKEFDNKFKLIVDKTDPDDDFVITTQETAPEIFQKLIVQLCEDPEYLLRLKKYIIDYLVDKVHREKQAKAVLPKDGKYYTTLNGEKVASKSEQSIADWLYRHNVKYKYEPEINLKDFNFQPDFYIPDAQLYIEHISNKSYNTKDKLEQFRKSGQLVEITTEEIMNDSNVFNQTMDSILRNRLPADHNFNFTLNYTEEFSRYHVYIGEFLRMVSRVMDMIKVGNHLMEDVFGRSQQDQHERIRSFYACAVPLMNKYKAYCVNKSYLDFNDLITTNLDLFRKHPETVETFRHKYKYILVDEFQDVNNLQVEMIKELLTPETQLFCVGDDWQSIYGFRGSNVGYIVNFETHFPDCEVHKLNLNYRSTDHIVGASNEVIKFNKFKVDKDIQAAKRSAQKIEVFAGSKQADNVEYVVNEVQKLLKAGIEPDQITILSRRTKMADEYRKDLKNQGIRIPIRTIHSSKGLESKVVFIIGLSQGSGGFPDVWLEDRIFQTIQPTEYELLLEEERRLFYVAITRAKDLLYLITEKGNESTFISEIPDVYKVRNNSLTQPLVEEMLLCPKCSSEVKSFWRYCASCGQAINN